mgnify:CR=1 FL=1
MLAGTARPTYRTSVAANAAKSGQQQQRSRRNAQLYELSDDDGWGVEVAAPAAPISKAQRNKAAAAQQLKPAKAATAPTGREVWMRINCATIPQTLNQAGLVDCSNLQSISPPSVKA